MSHGREEQRQKVLQLVPGALMAHRHKNLHSHLDLPTQQSHDEEVGPRNHAERRSQSFHDHDQKDVSEQLVQGCYYEEKQVAAVWYLMDPLAAMQRQGQYIHG